MSELPPISPRKVSLQEANSQQMYAELKDPSLQSLEADKKPEMASIEPNLAETQPISVNTAPGRTKVAPIGNGRKKETEMSGIGQIGNAALGVFGKGKVAVDKRPMRSRSQVVYNDSQSESEQEEEVTDQTWAQLATNVQGVPQNREDYKINERFRNYAPCFNNLTKTKNVPTKFPLVSVKITYNSKLVITVTKESDRKSWVKMYDLKDYSLAFEEPVGDPEAYIKLKEVEQNSTGDYFAIAYLNDGNFRVRTFGEKQRDDYDAILKDELDINAKLNIDNHTMPIDNFPDPYVTCTFLLNDLLYVNLNHSASGMHHMFVYNYVTKAITSHQTVQMEYNHENFPYKCFYSSEENEVYSFYRQGQGFNVPIKEIEHRKNEGKKYPYRFQQVHEREFGEMYLINERALVVRSSSQILFFKQVTDPFTFETEWENYETLSYRANSIYWIKGNKRIQITTDKDVFIYLIDPETFIPTRENVIKNFMGCTQMLFGNKVKYGITYKSNERAFDVWTRKYTHNYSIQVVNKNLEGSLGLPMESINSFLVSNVNEINVYDLRTYEEIRGSLIKIPLETSTTRERNEIISMVASDDDQQLVVITGQNLFMNEQQPNQMFIYKMVKGTDQDSLHDDNFELETRLKIREVPGLKKFAMQFKFKNNERDVLIFANRNKIFELNYMTKSIKDIFAFQTPLTRQPEFFLANSAQTYFIVASPDDGIYYDSIHQSTVDLDAKFNISNIKEMIYDEEDACFYLLANKYKEKLGLFLIRFNEGNPDEFIFPLKFQNKLSIGDADIAINRGSNKTKFKELIVSYKTIYMNTYSLQVFDISNKDDILAIFQLQNFQLWESKVIGFYAHNKNDFIIVNSKGIGIVEMGTNNQRMLKCDMGAEHILHSLESANYLKVDPRNFIRFEFSTENKVISIIQQFKKKNPKTGDIEDEFENVYNINVCDITLRELLLMQGLYVCRSSSQILQMVKAQPTPTVFYKTFLEFNGSNMVSILTFDSNSMKWLLDDQFSHFFDKDFPLFYKNKIQKKNNKKKFYFRSAIENALRNNQLRAVQCIVDYIVTYQNTYTSSYLFEKNICDLIGEGIEVKALFDSEIFCFQIDFDEWPANHGCDDEEAVPYNGSYFDLRYKYDTIFPDYGAGIEQEAKNEEPTNVANAALGMLQNINLPGLQEEKEESDSRAKGFKIIYKVNMLPIIDEYVIEDDRGYKEFVNEGQSLLDACCDSDEIEIFDVKNMQDYLDFKWEGFARSKQLTGYYFHLFNMTLLICYNVVVYVFDLEDPTIRRVFEYLLLVGVIYPTYYDFTQMYRSGLADYFSEVGNYFDMIYIISCITNVILQWYVKSQGFNCKLVFTIIFLMQIYKTFFFLQIYDWIAHLVRMIFNVVSDLKVFGLFFFIKVFLFSQIISVIGLANPNIHDVNDLRTGFVRHNEFKQYNDFADRIADKGEIENEVGVPGEEYGYFDSLFISNFFNVLRTSLGDFDFSAVSFMSREEASLFWIIWFLILLFSNIIFLNFIIAEASNSYAIVMEKLEAEVYKSRASLISEAQFMTFKMSKNSKIMPQFIIVRKADS